MRVKIEAIKSAIDKVSALTSDIKTVPGILLELGGTTLKVCFSDGHKSVIDYVSVEKDETDVDGSYVVGYDQFKRAIDNCMPSGKIVVSDVQITFKANNIFCVSVEQHYIVKDENGEIASDKKMATKKMDVAWTVPGSDIKSSILSRMKYNEIFEAKADDGSDLAVDTFDRKELIDALNKTSVEKGRQIYVSSKTQCAFVANQAHVTSVPISKYAELSQEDKDEILGSLRQSGQFDDATIGKAFADACAKAVNRVHYSLSITQTVTCAIVNVLSKASSDTVYLYTKDKYCNIFIDNEETGEKVGLWFEMPKASMAHIGALERYSTASYTTYMLTFFREFLVDIIKSVANNAKSEKIELKFVETANENPSSNVDLVINADNSAASIADTYSINADSVIDASNSLIGKSFKISIKVIQDMLAQLKTDLVAFDLCVSEQNTYVRLSELNYDNLQKAFVESRQAAQSSWNPAEHDGVAFDPATTPTPVEIKTKFMRRDDVLMTKQYTILSN